MFRYHFILAAIVAIFGVENIRAETQKLIRCHGPAIIGEVTISSDYYEVSTEAGLILIPQAEVTSLLPYIPFEQEYARRLGELPDGDFEARYRLAGWCRSQGHLARAADELRKILAKDPNHENARLLLSLIEKETEELTQGSNGLAASQNELAGEKLIGPEDIQSIRRSELRSSDKVKIVFRNNVLRRFVQAAREKEIYKQDDVLRFYRDLKPVQKAIEILDTLPERRDLHRDILILSNPQAISTFKSRIWPILERSCASAQCHGGPNGAGKLKLIKTSVKSDDVFYTNFLLMSSYRNLDGRMIDRVHPERSLLLNYSLPAGPDKKAHPGGKTDIFKNEQDASWILTDKWIRQLISPWSGYDVQFELPNWGKLQSPEMPPAADDQKNIKQ